MLSGDEPALDAESKAGQAGDAVDIGVHLLPGANGTRDLGGCGAEADGTTEPAAIAAVNGDLADTPVAVREVYAGGAGDAGGPGVAEAGIADARLGEEAGAGAQHILQPVAEADASGAEAGQDRGIEIEHMGPLIRARTAMRHPTTGAGPRAHHLAPPVPFPVSERG